MRAAKIGAVLVFLSSVCLTSCWLTDPDSSSNNCSFTETDSEWVYETSSYYEDGSVKYDVKVTVTDTGALEHYKTEENGLISTGAGGRCQYPIATMPSTANQLPDEEHPKTETRGDYTETYYCKGGVLYSESDHYYNFNDENSRYKSRKQMFDEHMKSCKAAGKYYSGGPFPF